MKYEPSDNIIGKGGWKFIIYMLIATIVFWLLDLLLMAIKGGPVM